jgi:hypothetical protein
MYDTGGTHSVCQPGAIDHDLDARLSWLDAAIIEVESGALARREAEESAVLRMRSPLADADAYAWFGLFLGLFPPAAIFSRLFVSGWGNSKALLWVCLSVVALAVCGALGHKVARFVGRSIGEPRRYGLPQLMAVAALFGAFWGMLTGGAGGAVFFGVGSLAGAFLAVPIGAAAFPLFALLHRQLSRGGMIEENLNWPLAFGLPLIIAVAVVGM